jgi:uncharacterized protein
VLVLGTVFFDDPHQPPDPPGTFLRYLYALAGLMRSFGSLIAMLCLAWLLEGFLPKYAAFSGLSRSGSDAFVRALPELVAFTLFSWVLLRFGHRSSLAELGLGFDWHALRDCVVFTLAGAAAVALLVLPLLLAGFGSFVARPAALPRSEELALLALFFFFAAMGEELLMRGYPFQTLIRPLHLLGALVAINSAFAGLHILNPGADEYSLSNTFLAGCILGMLFVLRRNLWAPIGAHFGWNLMTPLLGVPLSGMDIPLTRFQVRWSADSLWTGGAYGPEGSLPCLVLLSALLFVLVHLYYRRQSQATRELLDTPE